MEEFKEILESEGLTMGEFADLLDLTRGSMYSSIWRGHKNGAPRWVKAFVLGWRLGRKKIDP